MIRYATQADISELKTLWKQAFGDDDAFIDRFFAKRVLTDLKCSILLEEENEIISMLYVLPCVLRQGDTKKEYQAVNLVGVATKDSHKMKGYMRTLLEGAFTMLQEQGVQAVVLKPSNPKFYEQFGFHICNTLYKMPLTKEQCISPEETIAFLQSKTNILQGYHIVRSKTDWEFLLDDGYVVRAWQDGYAICEETADGLIAYEMVPVTKGEPCGYTMYKKIGQCPELPADIGCENLVFEWY